MGGHTREECRRWAACVRDIGLAKNAAMMAAYKHLRTVNGPKKARRHPRGGEKKETIPAAAASSSG
ncbi:unnamed protein product [Penicillium camemberti]|uniref:Str. FM013 n=1 Tax=Penicillium camemberti (strain FM 013) TaxID=1429867 RepID=A0A0G4PVC3_PENC3|nr:unnamed protein product [Penicillium camemberti]